VVDRDDGRDLLRGQRGERSESQKCRYQDLAE
jgi:hypothetical protein